jgi:hypothetical protein
MPHNRIVFDGKSSCLGVSSDLYLPRHSREASRGFEGPYPLRRSTEGFTEEQHYNEASSLLHYHPHFGSYKWYLHINTKHHDYTSTSSILCLILTGKESRALAPSLP